MATERIDIVISEKGSRVVKRGIESIGVSADKTSSRVNLLKGAFASLGAALGGRELLRLSDTYTTLQNRLRTVTQGTTELSVVTEELFNVANSTRQSYEGTAELFARVALSSKELGVSQKELLDVTKSLNQAVVLSGASAVESYNGLIQLSQGLASGALRGDELRSVLEQLPAVSDVIAKSMGVKRGQLRELGAQGAITADKVIQAFREAREELNERFSKSVITVSQALVVLRNNVLRLVGELDASTGVTWVLAQAILALAENLETLARAAGAVALVFSARLIPQGIAAATTAVRALTVAVAANPIGALVAGAVTAISALVMFSDKIFLGTGRLTTLRDVGIVVFQNIVSAIGTFVGKFQDSFAEISKTARDTFGGVELNVSAVVSFSLTALDKYIGAWVGAFRAITAVFSGLPAAHKDIFTRSMNGAIAIVEAGVNKIISALSSVTEFVGGGKIGRVSLGRLENNAAGASANLGKAVKDGFLSGLDENFIRGALERTLAAADRLAEGRQAANLANEAEREKARSDLAIAPDRVAVNSLETQGGRAGGAPPDFETLIDQLQREGEALRLNNQQREIQQQLLQFESELKRTLTEDETALVLAQLELNQGLADQAMIYDQINEPLQTYGRNVEALNALLEEGRISLDQYKEKLMEVELQFLETQKTMEAGISRALTKINQDLADASKQIETVVTNAFKKAEDAIVDFAKTGKMDFKGLVDSIISDLIRLAVQQMIMKPLMGMFGGMFGGGLLGFQHGGDFVVGGSGGIDSQLVAFRATPGEQVIVNRPQDDVQQKEKVGGGQTIVFNIATPTPETFRESETQIASRVARLVGQGRRNL